MAYKNAKRIFDKEVLSKRADEINMLKNKKNYKLVTTIVGRLKDVLRSNENLIALSAPQIGYPYRIFCVKFSDDEIRGFVNPLIYKYSDDMHLSREIQLGHNTSVEYIVPRFNEIEMSFQTPVGNLQSNLFKEVVGEVMQQMDDLLNGVMLEDYGLEVIEGFDEATPEEREEIIQMYLEHLQSQDKALQKVINEDEENAKINEAIEFMEQAKLGKVELAPVEEKPVEIKPTKKTTKKKVQETPKEKSVKEIIKDIDAIRV